MILDCFNGIYGFRTKPDCFNCGNEYDNASMFLDDIVAINYNVVSELLAPVYNSVDEYLNAKLLLALDAVKIDLSSQLISLGFMAQKQEEHHKAFVLKEPKEVYTDAVNTIHFSRLDDISNLTILQLKEVKVYPYSSGVVTLKIHKDNELVFESTKDVESNSIVVFNIPLKYSKYNEDFSISVESTALLYKTHHKQHQNNACYCNADNEKLYAYNYIALGASNSTCFSIYFSIYCDIDMFLCNNKNHIYRAVYHKIASSILYDLSYPKVLGSQSMYLAEELKAFAGTQSNQYKKYLKTATEILVKLARTLKDDCLSCGETRRFNVISLV